MHGLGHLKYCLIFFIFISPIIKKRVCLRFFLGVPNSFKIFFSAFSVKQNLFVPENCCHGKILFRHQQFETVETSAKSPHDGNITNAVFAPKVVIQSSKCQMNVGDPFLIDQNGFSWYQKQKKTLF